MPSGDDQPSGDPDKHRADRPHDLDNNTAMDDHYNSLVPGTTSLRP